MSGSVKLKEEDKNYWFLGGLFAAVGVYAILTAKTINDITGGVFLIALGLVFMAVISENFRTKLFDLFLSIFKGLWSSRTPRSIMDKLGL